MRFGNGLCGDLSGGGPIWRIASVFRTKGTVAGRLSLSLGKCGSRTVTSTSSPSLILELTRYLINIFN